MRHAKIVSVGVAAASLWAMAVAAQPGGPPPMHGGRPFMDNGAMLAIGALLHTEGLNDDQQQQMHAIMESGHASAGPLLDQLRAANQSLTDQLLGGEAPSADTLSSATAQIETLRQQLVREQVQTVQSLRAVLTAEQLHEALHHSQQFAAARGMVF
jgi:Spy/CpxP family protein refolding chaperone